MEEKANTKHCLVAHLLQLFLGVLPALHRVLGQLFVLALTVPVLDFLFRRWLPEVLGTIVLSAFLAHIGWHWMTERGGELIQYDFQVPVMDIGFAVIVLRWIMLGLIIVGTVWILRSVFGALPKAHAGAEGPHAGDPS